MKKLPTIQKNIPVPSHKYGVIEKRHEFLKTLAVGDSFTVDSISPAESWRELAARRGIKLTTRKLNGTGYRVWRIK